MPVSPKKRATNDKWDRENMTILGCKVRREYADRVRAAAARNGDAVNGIIKRALDAYLEQAGPEGPPTE